MSAPFRFILLLLAALGGTLAAHAAPYDVGGIAVEIPAPAGWDAVAPVHPFYAVARATVAADAQMLAAFVPHGFFPAHPADALPGGFLVATVNQRFAGERQPPDVIDRAKAAIEAEFAPYRAVGGPPVPLGIYADYRVGELVTSAARSVAWLGVGVVPPGGENGAGWREAYGGAVVYADGALVNLAIRAADLGPDDAGLAEVRRTLLDWAAAVEAANPGTAPAEDGGGIGTVGRVAAGVAVAALLLGIAAVLRRRRRR